MSKLMEVVWLADKVSFDDARYANAQGDFEEHILANRWVERLFKFGSDFNLCFAFISQPNYFH